MLYVVFDLSYVLVNLLVDNEVLFYEQTLSISESTVRTDIRFRHKKAGVLKALGGTEESH